MDGSARLCGAPAVHARGSFLRDAIGSGAGLERFRQIVETQGGDARIVDDDLRLPHVAARQQRRRGLFPAMTHSVVSFRQESAERTADRIRSQPWDRAYTFLKHEEDGGLGPQMALRLKGILETGL